MGLENSRDEKDLTTDRKVGRKRKEVANAGEVFGNQVIKYNLSNEVGVFACKWPRVYSMNNIDDIRACIATLADTDEGFVCHHVKTGKRLKIKNPRYLKISAIRFNGGLTQNSILKMLFEDNLDEYLLYFKCDEDICLPYKEAYEKFFIDLTKEYERKYKNLPYETSEDKKNYAMLLKDNPNSSLFFRMKQGKTAKESFDTLLWPSKRDTILRYKGEVYDMESGS